MGYKSKTSLTEIVALSEGYEATIRALRKADEDALQAILLGSNKTKGTTTLQGKADPTTVIDQSMDNAAYTTAMIQRGVSSWTLDDDAGNLLPITPAAINDLTRADTNTLVAAITALGESPDKSGTDQAG